ncbi:Glu/Leu/Phe/Val dehydrogenase, partial [Klebsiella pneumoniae]|nr:Glu/Leu/Phe/Val dehydrogenase [Klebsiella pneumoniae]
GLDIPALQAWQQEHGTIAGFPGADNVTEEAFWRLEYEILIPAALEGQISAELAAGLRCRLILEGANGPTLPEADDVLAERGIVL